MSKLEDLLSEWCDCLVDSQITDESDEYFGGFRCQTCDIVHGRADNAVYPLIFMYKKSGDEKYLEASKRLLSFRKLLTHEDGAVQNDFISQWKGISTFSSINLLKTLIHFADILPDDFKNNLELCAKKSAEWVHNTIDVGFRANVNYYAAASEVNALYYQLYSDKKYAEKGKKLLKYCMELFTENGLLTGEGQPHNFRTEKGCAPIDIGYNVEESLPCLVETAVILNEREALKTLTCNAKKLLDFMLPNGGWDNTFGVRNNKWTYYGSRTSDGSIGAFAILGKFDPIFYEAAERTYEILKKCTSDKVLYGGLNYKENGQKPCIHHTFCHACALTDAILTGLPESFDRQKLPCDSDEIGYKYYKEIDTYKISVGKYLATITGYDYSTYTYVKGAAHSGGGALSMLYKKGSGIAVAGSVYDYKPTEINNMQLPENDIAHRSLIIRAEYEKNGIMYATCLDKNAEINVSCSDNCVTAHVKAKFCCVENSDAENENLMAEFDYIFSEDSVFLSVRKINENIKLVVPLIGNTVEIQTENKFKSEKIFFLTGGFKADEYTFNLDENIQIKIV